MLYVKSINVVNQTELVIKFKEHLALDQLKDANIVLEDNTIRFELSKPVIEPLTEELLWKLPLRKFCERGALRDIAHLAKAIEEGTIGDYIDGEYTHNLGLGSTEDYRLLLLGSFHATRYKLRKDGIHDSVIAHILSKESPLMRFKPGFSYLLDFTDEEYARIEKAAELSNLSVEDFVHRSITDMANKLVSPFDLSGESRESTDV